MYAGSKSEPCKLKLIKYGSLILFTMTYMYQVQGLYMHAICSGVPGVRAKGDI